jgi:hypothetical protein
MRAHVAVVVLVGWLIGVGRAGADEKPAAGKGYELRVVAHGDAYNGIRFKPTTGESWKILNGRFEKLEEVAAPPAGDYDVVIIPAEILLAVRIDRSTGSCWLLAKSKWNPVTEPAPKLGAAPAKAPGPDCALRHIVVGEQLHVVRFHTKTGETWHLSGDTFAPMGEFGKVPAGDFDLTMIASKKDWMAFRLDRKSGKSWLLQANIWAEITEPE